MFAEAARKLTATGYFAPDNCVTTTKSSIDCGPDQAASCCTPSKQLCQGTLGPGTNVNCTDKFPLLACCKAV